MGCGSYYDPRDQSSHRLVSGRFCPALLHPSPDSGELGIWGKRLPGLFADFAGASRRAIHAGLKYAAQGVRKMREVFPAIKVEQRVCAECFAAERSTTIRPRTCRECGATFDGGPRAWYCPNCRAIRKKSQLHDATKAEQSGLLAVLTIVRSAGKSILSIRRASGTVKTVPREHIVRRTARHPKMERGK